MWGSGCRPVIVGLVGIGQWVRGSGCGAVGIWQWVWGSGFRAVDVGLLGVGWGVGQWMLVSGCGSVGVRYGQNE